MRINARLDEEQARELDYLKRVTRSGTTEVVKNAIGLYYRELRKARGHCARILGEVGSIACGDADPGLSRDYKEGFEQGLAAKHGHR